MILVAGANTSVKVEVVALKGAYSNIKPGLKGTVQQLNFLFG